MAYTSLQYRADAKRAGQEIGREARKWLRGLWKIRSEPQRLFGPTFKFGLACSTGLGRLFFYTLRRLANI